MRCPFNREATVKSCRASSFRKMIPEAVTDTGHERCSSREYVDCAAFAAKPTGFRAAQRCPFLQETLVAYCSAAAVPKYIPAAEGLLPRCNSERFRYCELYLGEAGAPGERTSWAVGSGMAATAGPPAPETEGIAVPSRLVYAPNHMWLDVAGDGSCHVGVDEFLARVVGSIERITFVAPRAVDRPTAVLTVNGVDLQMVFPKRLESIAPNAYVRTCPSKVVADPYGAGWLFEATQPPHAWSALEPEVEAALIGGDEALRWVHEECDRLAEFVHERVGWPRDGAQRLVADGGRVEPGLAPQLGRDDLVNLFNEFFSSHAAWRGSR
jgi:glycine cleavage system H lipoate-binding protein